jgi:hypothetical protein
MGEFKRLTCVTDCLEHNDAIVKVKGHDELAFAINLKGQTGRQLNTKDGKDGNTPILCDVVINT